VIWKAILIGRTAIGKRTGTRIVGKAMRKTQAGIMWRILIGRILIGRSLVGKVVGEAIQGTRRGQALEEIGREKITGKTTENLIGMGTRIAWVLMIEMPIIEVLIIDLLLAENAKEIAGEATSETTETTSIQTPETT
jgi:hypothetical protein